MLLARMCPARPDRPPDGAPAPAKPGPRRPAIHQVIRDATRRSLLGFPDPVGLGQADRAGPVARRDGGLLVGEKDAARHVAACLDGPSCPKRSRVGRKAWLRGGRRTCLESCSGTAARGHRAVCSACHPAPFRLRPCWPQPFPLQLSRPQPFPLQPFRPRPLPPRGTSGCVVEDEPEGEPGAGTDHRYAVPDGSGRPAAAGLDGAVAGGEDQSVTMRDEHRRAA